MGESTRRLTPKKLAAAALVRWGGDVASLRSVARSENFVFRFRSGAAARERYLRLSPPNYRPREEIEAELDFVRHLHARGVPVAPPVRSRHRKWVETIDHPQGELHAAVFEGVRGESPRWGSDADNRKMLFERGRALGRMHAAARSFRPTISSSRFHWYEDDLFTDPQRYFPKNERAARREYQALIHWMLDRPATNENYGIVHGDFGSGNALRQPDGSLVAYDFDDCLYHWYSYDLAVSIRTAAMMPYRRRREYLRVLMNGYESEKDLCGDGAQEIGQFCRLAALYRYVAVLRDHERGRVSAESKRLLEARRAALRHPVKWN
jgi:Ser/Thr protein kinase RdoA (MazF antagonist)